MTGIVLPTATASARGPCISAAACRALVRRQPGGRAMDPLPSGNCTRCQLWPGRSAPAFWARSSFPVLLVWPSRIRRSGPIGTSADGIPGPSNHQDRAARPRLTPARRAVTIGGVHFGVFVEELRHGATQAGAFRDIFETADRAEAGGVDCVWLGEIHFTPSRSVISAPLQGARAIAARTPRPPVGTPVHVPPPHQPPRLAAEGPA